MSFRKPSFNPASTGSCSASNPEPARCGWLAAAALAATLLPATGHAAAAAWQGELEVLQQAGAGCVHHPAAPYRLPVQAVGEGGTAGPLLVWGGMQAVRLLPGAADAAHRMEVIGDSGSIGMVAWTPAPAGLRGEWREEGGATTPGCNFTLGTLRLDAVQDAERQATQFQFAAYLTRLHEAQAALKTATTPAAARAPAGTLTALAQELPAASDADRNLAQLFIASAEQLGPLRQRPAALALLRATNVLYRRQAANHPEDAALALALEARAVYRDGGLSAAQPLLQEAMDLLQSHGRTASGAASSVLALRGVWQLRAGDLSGALAAFRQSVQADEARGAPAGDLAISLSNLGTAVQAAGQADAALQIYRRALALAEAAGDDAASLVEIIRAHIASLSDSAREVRA